MTTSLYVNLIKEELEKVRLCRHQMVIVVGLQRNKAIDQFAQETGIEPINLNLYLSDFLLKVPVNRRARKVSELVNHLLIGQSDVAVLERIELLFLPELQTDPIRLFENISRNICLVIDWNGKYENNILTFSRPDHPEYRSYPMVEASIIQTN